jgi:hypothetical protein
MPKDEFDFEDPLELNGVAFLTQEDTTDAMCECFIEEFMRMGYNAKQVLALFRNPHYIGMNMVLEKRGEAFIRDSISEVFVRWGKPVSWPATEPVNSPAPEPTNVSPPRVESISDTSELTDPMGAPIPSFHI